MKIRVTMKLFRLHLRKVTAAYLGALASFYIAPSYINIELLVQLHEITYTMWSNIRALVGDPTLRNTDTNVLQQR